MIVLFILITFCTFVFMEGVTWFTHKFIMHGFLWVLHEDHHYPRKGQVFQKNDSFFFIFATPSILLFYFGINPSLNYTFFIGLGILFYGMAYFLVHDVFIHQRFSWLSNVQHPYFLGLRRAHGSHHTGGKCFGMLWVPRQFIREAKENTLLANEN
ncbi:sterol desaturase family protein [Carboxylicivirga marina]|uniref:Sterol desaturase family protein n=1 Tax=Carboxylicivirga marina TaxID=2800988 RepID=A0ABS1HJT7_9BACT|nr:sterol desaturase family protein [Carboxylicivirga marina]MBK3517543.1 sterol desaturase family protein [Carboxylicivirga marina]